MDKHSSSAQNRDRRLEMRLQEAIRQQREGNLAGAQRNCRRILQKMPQHRETLQLLAILLQQSGNSRAALHFMQKAASVDPDNPHLLRNLAEIYRSCGNYDAAQKHALAALEIEPRNADALFVSAAVYLQQGETGRARAQFTRVVAVNPEDFEAHNELANLMSAAGKLEGAISHYRRALSIQPDFVDCRINLADSLLQAGDADTAIEQYLNVLQARPQHAAIHERLGQAYLQKGDSARARSCFELALEQDPLRLEVRICLGQLVLQHDPRQAEIWFKSVLDIDPNHAMGYYWLGILYQTRGQFERATNYLQQAVRLNPQLSVAWYRISLDRGFRPSTAQLEALETQFNRFAASGSDDEQLVALDFALGRFHEQRSDYASAFHYFQHGNRIRSAQLRFDPVRHRAQVDKVIEIFDAGFFGKRSGWGNSTQLPVFIVGMPRSGTSLVEQILASHSAVHGAGELRDMLELSAGLKPDAESESGSHARRVAALDQAQVGQIAQQQLRRLASLAPSAERVTDKLPGNYFRLGMIHLLFPRARIVHCRRDPMDSCWSCYQQNFDSGLNFSYDLDHLGQVYRGYERLMSHWRKLFGEQILDLDYEDLVRQPEAAGRRLLEHCGLDWQDRVLDFQGQDRAITTASIWQVRQPLYQSSIGRWRHYRQYLQALQQSLSA